MTRRKLGRAALIALLVFATGAMAAGNNGYDNSGKDKTKKNGAMKKGNGSMDGSSYDRMYDASTVEMVKGSIVKIDSMAPETGMMNIVCVMVKTNGDTMMVHLAPASYLKDKGIMLRTNKQIEATGSRTMHKGETVLIASKIKTNGKEIELRGEDGHPHWKMGEQ